MRRKMLIMFLHRIVLYWTRKARKDVKDDARIERSLSSIHGDDPTEGRIRKDDGHGAQEKGEAHQGPPSPVTESAGHSLWPLSSSSFSIVPSLFFWSVFFSSLIFRLSSLRSAITDLHSFIPASTSAIKRSASFVDHSSSSSSSSSSSAPVMRSSLFPTIVNSFSKH